MPIPSFGDIGKAPKELLSGAKSSGVFQFDPKLTVATTTSTGVTFTATATQKADKLDSSLKAAYSTKKYSVDATIDPTSKISCNASLSGVAPGVKLTASAVVPDLSTGKVGVEYSNPYVNLKSTVALKASPVLDLALASGYQNIVLGGEAAYDSGKSLLTKYNFGLGYHAPDFQVRTRGQARSRVSRYNLGGCRAPERFRSLPHAAASKTSWLRQRMSSRGF